MNMKKSIILLGSFLLCQLVLGQDWETATREEVENSVKKMEAMYLQESYGFKVFHSTFMGHAATVPSDEAEGYFYKSGARFHANLMGIETIQDETISVSAMPAEKHIFLLQPDTKLVGQFTPIEKEKVYQLVEKIEKKKDKGSLWYRYTYKEGLLMEKVELQLGSTGFIKDMKMFYAQIQEWTDNEGTLQKDKPRMDIQFVQVKPKTIKEIRFDPEYMVLDHEEGYAATPRFQGYEVFDMRISN